MDIIEATKSYESWLADKTPLLKEDLRLKHERMRRDPFLFLRATYYRWAQVFPRACKSLGLGPTVLAVGDLHVENFGTWRDADARLVWGINDFDECYPLPYTHDLARLAVSVYIAIAEEEMDVPPKSASAAILEGYRAGLKAGGKPFVLVDKSTPLRVMARDRLDAPEHFWLKFHRIAPIRKPVPEEVIKLIDELLPEQGLPLRFLHRIAGTGSLGKQRFTAVGNWSGGPIAREAKALTPSACQWADGKAADAGTYYGEIIRLAVRCPDPMLKVRGAWLLRRLSPDCFRIELADLPEQRDELYLLHAMGWETANVHLGSGRAKAIAADLKRRPGNWLHPMAKVMREATMADWKVWKKRG